MTGKDKLITAATLGTLAILLFHECATSGRKGPVAAEPPADEVGVVAEAAGLHDALDAAQTSANEFRVTQAETNAAVFLDKAYAARKWTAAVESVRSTNTGVVVEASFRSLKFHLYLADESAVQVAKAWTAGHPFTFDGDTGPEMSLTIRGGLSGPEFYLAPTALTDPGASLTQDAAAIARTVSEYPHEKPKHVIGPLDKGKLQ